MSSPLREILQSRRAIVRRRIKSLLSTHPHTNPARLSGAGVSLPDALMRPDQPAAVCPVGGVGGLSLHGGDLHGADRRFFCSVEPHNSAQQGCEVLSGFKKREY
jgi:hypothetical protein